MLSQEHIPIGKLKQAYELSENDVTALMAKLLPNHVFPYLLWKNAYTDFWQWSVRECTQRYRVKEPQFPDTEALPEKYFPTPLYTTLIKRYFIDISRIIKIAELEKGTDYIIEATYGANGFPFKEQKAAFFYALRQEENSLENWQRTSGPLKIDSMEAAGDCYIPDWFFDTIVVDKSAAIIYLDDGGYKLEHEVKGITHALVERTIAERQKPSQMATSPHAHEAIPTLPVPRSLWEGKTRRAVREAMRKEEFSDVVIAHILLTRCEAPKTEIAKILDTNTKRIRAFLEEAAALNIIDS